jgi:hypothetical protein
MTTSDDRQGARQAGTPIAAILAPRPLAVRAMAGCLVVVAALLITGCSGPRSAGTAAPGASTPPAATTAAVDGCVPASQALPIDLGGPAAVLGTGVVGVVLSNQSDQNLCGWLPFASTLAARGYRVLLHDDAGSPAQEILRAIAALRTLGARRVFLVGASQGAKASLVAAASTRPLVAGVVSVSPEQSLQGADLVAVAARLRVSVLYLAARYVEDAPRMLYRATTQTHWRRLAVVAGRTHGTGLPKGPRGAYAQALILSFLGSHGR